MHAPGYFASETLHDLAPSADVTEILRNAAQLPSARAALGELQSAGDYLTLEHTLRVTELAVRMGIILDFDQERLSQMAVGGYIHDWAKLDPDTQIATYSTAGPSDPVWPQLWSAITRHPAGSVRRARLHGASVVALGIAGFHHAYKRNTAASYGVESGEVPEIGRDHLAEMVVAAADTYDAWRSERPYRQAMAGREEAVRQTCADLALDPRVYSALEQATKPE